MWEGYWGITMASTPDEVSGSATRRRRRWLYALTAASAVWMAGVGGYGAWTWPEAHAALQKELDEGTRGCRRYAGKARQDRCIDLFKLIYEGERNAGIFTRVVFAVLPPGTGLGAWFAWLLLARRAEAARRNARRVRPRPPPDEPS
jgi:hypothetical protein